ncbi:hypothetical protein D918_06181 [Trichuris suis]|nr:hypothetical protein D918_06181 [Trichuris suis]
MQLTFKGMLEHHENRGSVFHFRGWRNASANACHTACVNHRRATSSNWTFGSPHTYHLVPVAAVALSVFVGGFVDRPMPHGNG